MVPNPITGTIGSTPYTYYTITGSSNLANPSTIVTGSITNYNLLVEYSINGGAYNTYANVNNSDISFGIETALVDGTPGPTKYTFRATLTTTSNLGVTDIAQALFGYTNSGYTSYRGLNPNATVVYLPSISSQLIVENMLIYPNPSINIARVNVKVENATAVTIRIYSMNGKLVQQQRQDVLANRATQNFLLNVNSLASGTYTVIAVDDKGRIIGNSKLVKTTQ